MPATFTEEDFKQTKAPVTFSESDFKTPSIAAPATIPSKKDIKITREMALQVELAKLPDPLAAGTEFTTALATGIPQDISRATEAVGNILVRAADIPTKLANLGKAPSERTPTLEERTVGGGKIIELPRVSGEGVGAGLANLALGTTEQFVSRPQSGLMLPLFAMGGGVGRAAAVLFAAPMIKDLPDEVRNAKQTLNSYIKGDPNVSAADVVEQMGKPVVNTYLAGKMVEHGITSKIVQQASVAPLSTKAMLESRAEIPKPVEASKAEATAKPEAPKVEAPKEAAPSTPAEPKPEGQFLTPTVEVGGKRYYGRTHSEAVGKARAAGEKVPDENEAMRKFENMQGELVDRKQAQADFEDYTGKTIERPEGLHSEDLIEAGMLPKEAAPEAAPAEKPEPPVAEGNVRVYHSEGGAGGAGLGGAHAAESHAYSATFGPDQYFVDVPKAEFDAMKAEARGRGKPADLILSKERVKELKPVAKPIEPPTHVLEPEPEPAKPTGKKSVPYSEPDLARYREIYTNEKQLRKQGIFLTPEGDFTPEYQALQNEFEALRNKYGGMPPAQGAGLPATPTPEPVPEMAGMGAAKAGELPAGGAGADIYGIAHRVRAERAAAGQTGAVPRGKGTTPEEILEHGRKLHSQGADPQKALTEFEKTKRISADDIALVRYQGELLSRNARSIEEKFGTDSDEYRAAWKQLADWDKRTKPMQTEWHKMGAAQQGQTDIDTGTFTGLQRAYSEATGKDFTPTQAKTATKLAKGVTVAKAEAAAAKQKLYDQLEMDFGKMEEPPPKTPEEARLLFAKYKPEANLTLQQIKTIWNWAKQAYIGKGEQNLENIAQGVADDLGLPKKTVMDALAAPKGSRKLSNEMYLKMARERQAVFAAKDWLANANTPGWLRFLRNVPRFFFMAKVFGHGTVGMVTHAGPLMFDPAAASVYWPVFFKQYKLMFSPAFHERAMQELMHDPYFVTARRAGLANDPFRYQDDYQNPKLTRWTGKFGLSGNRGFDSLKLIRQARWNQIWDTLNDELKTPEMAKLIADNVNHSTGVVKSDVMGRLAEPAAVAFFAPKLELSRWAFIIGDPVKAAKTFATWKDASPEQRTSAMMEVKQKARIAGTYLGLLALNEALLRSSGSDQKVNFDNPRRGDYLAFKVAGQNVSVISPMLHMIGFLSQLMRLASVKKRTKVEELSSRGEELGQTGFRYVRGKLSPFAGPVTDILTQSDYQGRPLPYSEDKVPTWMSRRGIERWTWPEYAIDTASPIPVEEAIREVWASQGMSENEIKTYLKALAVFTITGGTGIRLSEDIHKE